MRILFVVASVVEEAFDIADAPIGLGYIISYAQSKGLKFEYKVISSVNYDREFRTFLPDLVAVSAFSVTYGIACRIAEKSKAAKIPCIVGGIHVSLLPGSLSRNFTLGVIGEGEITFMELLESFQKQVGWPIEQLKKINGIAFYDAEQLVINKPRDFISNLDEIPFPVDLSALQSANRMTTITSRGCPYRCVFCAPSRLWNKVRFNSPEYMIEHMERYVKAHPGIHQVKIFDDLFSVNKTRLSRFVELLKNSKLLFGIKFFVLCRVDSIDKESIQLFKEMNVSDVFIGVESGCQKTLDYIGKKYTVDEAARALELLNKEKFLSEATYIVGFPEETYDDAEQTFKFIKKYQQGLFRVFPLTPLPSTPIWDIALGKGIVSEDENMKWERLGMVIKGDAKSLFFNGEFPLVIESMTRAEFYEIFGKIEAYRKQLRHRTFIKYLFKQPWRLYDYLHYQLKFYRTKI